MIHGSDMPLSLGAWFNHMPEQVVIKQAQTDLTRLDVLHRVALIQANMQKHEVKSCVLYTSDTTLFVATFLACACTGVELILPANNSEDFIQFIEADWFVGDWPEAELIDFTNLQTLTPQHIGAGFEVSVFTSGSTGEPKRINRSIEQLLSEVNTLHTTFAGSDLSKKGVVFAATVSHQHIYGLLFKILWPLLTSQIIWHKLIAFEESLEEILSQFKRVALISSPAFLKRIHSQVQHQGQLLKVYSSGGLLTDEQQQLAEAQLNSTITQVYGSSETGGIAFRNFKQKWQLFNHVEAQIKNKLLWVNSPYCYQSGWLCTHDKIKVSDEGFELLGRIDRIVKIEEKRVSLNQVEKLLRDHPYISDAAVIKLENSRQYLGAVIVLNKTDQQQLERLGPLKLKQHIKQHLATQLDAVAIPRKIVFTTEHLENTQGKRIMADIERRLR